MIDIEAIKKRLAAATPGPWAECGQARGGCICGHVFAVRGGDGPCVATTDTVNDDGMPYPDDDQRKANAALIAHAPRDLADLLAEVERLRAGVPYRPGLPSVEQVRAHEARGGWWQGRYPACRSLPPQIGCFQRPFGLPMEFSHIRYITDSPSSVLEYRPCDADGTPCEWLP